MIQTITYVDGVIASRELREDGSFGLREDGSFDLREEFSPDAFFVHTIALVGAQTVSPNAVHVDSDGVAFVHTIANFNQILTQTSTKVADDSFFSHQIIGGAFAVRPVEVASVAGTAFYIASGSPDDYIQVGQLTSIGEVGIRWEGVEIMAVVFGQDYERKIKGVGFSPTLTLVYNRDLDDIGQAALIVANSDLTDQLFHFKIVETDAVVTTFQGKVFNLEPSYGSANQIIQITAAVEIDPETIVVTPA